MKANYHTHTKRCQHAEGEDREYVEAAIEAGYEMLGFADHCPWIFPDGYISNVRMRTSEVEGYFVSLESLRKEYERDITILIGFEAEYFPPLIEAQDELLKDYPLDYMILAQHFMSRDGKKCYAGSETDSVEMLKHYVDLCIGGMQTGRYKYLAHPDLIHYVGDSAIYEKEMKRLCEAMKENNVPLEMNILGLLTGRNYPDGRFWDIAKTVGNRAIIGMDAHTPEQLSNPNYVEKAKLLCEGMEIIEKLEIK